MRLIITEEHVGEWASFYVAKTILDFKPTAEKPFILGITGGTTVLPMYKRLVEFYRDGVLSFNHVHFFNTGEYIGISKEHPSSFYSYIHENLFSHIDVLPDHIHLLNGSSDDIKIEAKQYEQTISQFGGVHLWICGLGDDGHLAFNEPGSSIKSRTRDKELTFETRVANAKFFHGDIALVPQAAITVGIGTLLDSKEILVLAQGKNKAAALQLSLEDGINHMHPASALQLHPKATCVADEQAVSDIRVRTYRYHKDIESKSLHPNILIKGLYQSYYALVNARVFDGEKYIENAAVIIENDRIKSIETYLSADTVLSKIDLKGKTIIPGYIDLQVNGCGGSDINQDISIDTLKTMYQTCLRHGVTSLAPTLITTSDEHMLASIDLLNRIQKPELLGIICWHFEGPYLSRMKKGVHEEKYIRKPSNEMLDQIIHAHVPRKIITLAPEENSAEHIKKLTDAGVIVSMGHTNGTYSEILEKQPYGITMATHLYNAMRPFDSREPGALGAVLDSKNIYAGIIADGVHCNYASVDIAYKSLKGRLFLVSDAVFVAGTDIKEFTFAGRTITHKDGKCYADDGTLSGAATMLDICVRNVVEYVGIPKEEAFRMASLYPAQSIRMDHEYGYIKPGYKADLTILDDDLFVQGVVANGQYISKDDL